MYIGSWAIDDLLTFVVNTQVFATGVATDADSAPTYRVYEDETTTPILTGSMALLDSSNTAGFYSEQITLSAANGFEKGKSYSIYITATVSSVAGATHRTFQIQAAVDVKSVGGSAIQQASGYVKVSEGTGTGQLDLTSGRPGVDWAKVSNPTTTLNLSGTTVKTATDVETDTADIQTNVNAILADTGTDGVVVAAASKTGYALSSAGVQAIWDALTSALTTVGSVGKLLADNLNATVSSRSSHAAADIWAVATRLLTAGTNIVLAKGTGITGFNDLNAAGVRSAVGMASDDLDTQLDAILAASGGSAPSASTIADAVWDELLSGHVVSGSAGVALSNAGAHAGGGAVLTSFTINDQAGHPLDGVLIEISTDEDKENVIASAYTLTNGIAQLNLDPGDYYLWKNRGGYDFENPEEITVS